MSERDRYTPENPPGYVFVTNNGQGGEPADIHARLGQQLGIPVEAFLTMDDMVASAPSSTFVEAQYASVVDGWTRHIHDMLQELKRIAAQETRNHWSGYISRFSA